LACHLQIDADQDLAYNFDAAADPDPADHVAADPDADPDSTVPFNLMQIHADLDPQHC
jgi:hypothetical protein